MSRLATIRSKLNQLRIPELRNVLVDLNLARSGRKIELVDRIAMTLESFEAKAAENNSNHATAAFYTDQLSAGLRSIDAQLRASRPQMHGSGQALAHTPPGSHAVALGHAHPASHYASGASMAHRNIPSYHGTPAYHQQHNHSNQRPPALPPGLSPLSASGGRSNGGAMKSANRILSGPDGSMTLTPVPAPELHGARCYCNGDNSSGAVVKCTRCRKGFHAKCNQIPPTATEWYCEVCRADIYDPFYTTKRRIIPGIAVQFVRSPSVYRFSYSISDKDINDMYSKRDAKPGAMTPGSLELQLRCFQVKDDLANGTCWPTSTTVSVNGFNVPIIQRAPPGQANPSKVLRELPANLFPFTRVGPNKVEIRTSENPGIFVFMVQIVEVRDINDLIKDVKLASETITYEKAKQDVIKSFGDEDEDDVVALSTILSVRCPLGLCVINMPARGLHCKHLQCFDLRTFLQFSKKARSKAYRCTVCHNFIKASDLRIDPYFKKLLADVEHDEELEEVEILPDASWRKRITEDSEPAHPAKRFKTEQVEAPAPGTASASESTNNGGASTGAAAVATTNDTIDPGSSGAPFEIDLSLSSEEEGGDDPDLAPVAANRATSSSRPPPPAVNTSSGLGSSVLLDEDVAVLTVDSDVWDTNRSTSASNEMQLASALGMGNGNGANGDMFPFPLDDSIFASLAPSSNGGGQTGPGQMGSTGNWSQMYGGGMPYMSSSVPMASSAYPSTSSSSWNPPPSSSSGLMQHSEVDLASTMAMLSQDTPPQINRRQQSQTARPAEHDPLDIICLLDSDSD
ncbi:hypothetical protein Gpo141_00009560 [Globisporangium polare]